MFAIIYWLNNNSVYPFLTGDEQLRLFDKLSDADEVADRIEKRQIQTQIAPDKDDEIECRVINIEGIKQ